MSFLPNIGSIYVLKNKATGFYLYGKLDDEPALTVFASIVNPYEYTRFGWWRFEATDFGCYRLVHEVTGRVLDSNLERQVYINMSNGGSFQKWRMNDSGDGSWCLQNLATGFALDSNNDQDVYTMAPNNGAYQRWDFFDI